VCSDSMWDTWSSAYVFGRWRLNRLRSVYTVQRLTGEDASSRSVSLFAM